MAIGDYFKHGIICALATHAFCYFTNFSIWKVGLAVTGVTSFFPLLLGLGISAKSHESFYFWGIAGLFFASIGVCYWMPLGVGSLVRFGAEALLKN